MSSSIVEEVHLRDMKSCSLLFRTLRIYLLHKLEIAQQKLSDVRFESSVHTRCQTQNPCWEKVVTAAELIVQYIKKCQADDGHNLFLNSCSFGLASIDRA